MRKLLYIGKSNKTFTHNKLYNFYGSIEFTITVDANKGSVKSFNMSQYDYFKSNFKVLNEKEINNFNRKQKIKNINKNG